MKPIQMSRHEDICPTILTWTFPLQPFNLLIVTNLIALERHHLFFLLLMLDFFRLRARFLLAFLASNYSCLPSA